MTITLRFCRHISGTTRQEGREGRHSGDECVHGAFQGEEDRCVLFIVVMDMTAYKRKNNPLICLLGIVMYCCTRCVLSYMLLPKMNFHFMFI